MDTKKEGEVIELTDSDSNSDVEDESKSKSCLSAYDKIQRKAFGQHQEDIEGINILRQHNSPKVSLDQRANPKGKMNLMPKQPRLNLKDLHHQHEQEAQKFLRQVIENYVSLEEKKLAEEQKNNEWMHNLEKEKMERHFVLEREQMVCEVKLKEKESRLEAFERWLKSGKSEEEIERLIKLTYAQI
ncbi:hypothetical protein O181_032361 [Austropuccinia psidii MF-1]|uniref:Uncharacterized protein n=1 Tax=Austropuccinia psidii MF-1 TaxID=1389203 RepID=A0A9Q3CWN3_9BASI|nr:hypothetical protein [Austropuccinia psidii MF-1]